MNYTTIRLIHISCAVLSVSLFVLRGLMQQRGIDWRRWQVLRIAPHINDTVLLTAAITLAVMSSQMPWESSWLGAKVIALLFYIGIGRIALSRTASQSTRWWAFGGATACVGYIVLVAVTRSPWLGLL